MDDIKLEDIENSAKAAKTENEKAEAALRRFDRRPVDIDAQKQFRQEFSQLDSAQKGSWGERVVINEAKEAGHTILIGHSDNPTGQGFDCASYDPATKTLHIWEVKNFGEKTSSVDSKKVTAWQDESKSGTKYADARDAYEKSWQKVLDFAPDGAARDVIKQAIAEGRVVFHLRLGPDTKISGNLQQELETAQVPGSTYDWDRYTYNHVLKVGSGV